MPAHVRLSLGSIATSSSSGLGGGTDKIKPNSLREMDQDKFGKLKLKLRLIQWPKIREWGYFLF